MLPPKEKTDLMQEMSKIITARGFYFVDFEERTEKGSHILSVVIHKEPSVTIGDCENITKALLPLLESKPWFGDNDQLEVTSPGLDRVLKREEEYEIFKGRKVDITFTRDENVQTLRATLVGKDNEDVIVDVDGTYYRIPFNRIRKAKLVFEEGGEKHGKKQKRSHRKSA
ncbi:ribosome maturation factor RimP [Coprothermobacter platensis]|uniref:ribosome maturation factor RimP n=1 Tax=Coprothermobacter platensis TaxID=108819 RepID=UPI000382A3E5|nr:ribosome maturation factor [Coprothermobacter platensis]